MRQIYSCEKNSKHAASTKKTNLKELLSMFKLSSEWRL